jgi:hypothetical protein
MMLVAKETRFAEHFITVNGLDRRDFQEWILYPGMLFQASRMWWGERGMRPAPHEGLDLCLYRDWQGRVHRLDERYKIPVLYDGVVVGIIGDFLGQSVIVKHDIGATVGGGFCTIYGHTVPGGDICVGEAVQQGEVIASVADASRSRSAAVPHLHISVGLASQVISYSGLTWETIGNPDTMTLVDPLPFIDRYYLAAEDTVRGES